MCCINYCMVTSNLVISIVPYDDSFNVCFDFFIYFFQIRLKDTLSNMNGQLEKNDMTKAALQKLCNALKVS